MSEKQYFVRNRGKVSGPFSLDQLRALQRRGQLKRFYEVSEDRRNWQEAGALPVLFAKSDLSGQTAASQSIPQWYYAEDRGEDGTLNQGPFSVEQIGMFLQNGTITASTPVWKDGMPDWVPVGAASEEGFLTLPHGPKRKGRAAAFAEPSDNRGWARARAGVTLTLLSTCVYCGTLSFGTLGLFVALLWNPRTAAVAAMVLMVFGWIITLATSVLDCVGYGFCAAVPARSGAKGLGITALVLAIGAAVFILLMELVALTGGTVPLVGIGFADAFAGITGALSAFVGVLVTANTVIYLLYLRSLVQHLQEHALARQFLYLLILFGALCFFATAFVVLFFLMFPTFVVRAEYSAVFLWYVVGVVLAGSGLTWLIWYVVALFQVRRVIKHTD